MDKPGQTGEFIRGIKTALPVMLGFIPFGLVLGAQATQKGFSVLEVPLMTGINFGGEVPNSPLWNYGHRRHIFS